MPESIPLYGPQPVVLTFKYEVSDAWIEEQILETGVRPSKDWKLTVDLREVPTKEARKTITEGYQSGLGLGALVELDEPTDDPVEVAKVMIAVELFGGDSEQSLADAKYETGRREWIEEHASERLRLAYRRGYVVNRLYVVERSRKEMPGFWVDTTGAAAFKSRANPSVTALNLETGVDEHLARLYDDVASVIVWMTEPPRDLQTHIEEQDLVVDEQMEALLVSGWLGRHDLYLPIDPELHAPISDEDES